MTERKALQSAIRNAPGDELPRLVYADWLEEHGEIDAAAMLRTNPRAAAWTESWANGGNRTDLVLWCNAAHQVEAFVAGASRALQSVRDAFLGLGAATTPAVLVPARALSGGGQGESGQEAASSVPVIMKPDEIPRSGHP
jgi:uncharacterized protein (TIGR02996 family)